MSGVRWELALERAAHRETQEHLQRALRAGMHWKMQVEELKRGDAPQQGAPQQDASMDQGPSPIPIPNPCRPVDVVCAGTGDGGGGGHGADDVVELLFATVAGLAQLGGWIVDAQPATGSPSVAHLLAILQHRVELLSAALRPAEGVGGGAAAGARTHQGGRG
jgi:hypothetical protein